MDHDDPLWHMTIFLLLFHFFPCLFIPCFDLPGRSVLAFSSRTCTLGGFVSWGFFFFSFLGTARDGAQGIGGEACASLRKRLGVFGIRHTRTHGVRAGGNRIGRGVVLSPCFFVWTFLLHCMYFATLSNVCMGWRAAANHSGCRCLLLLVFSHVRTCAFVSVCKSH